MRWAILLFYAALAGCASSSPPAYYNPDANLFPPPPVQPQQAVAPSIMDSALFSRASVGEISPPSTYQPPSPQPTYASAATAAPRLYTPPAPRYSSGCQSGNYYGAISCVTGLPKTTYVRSYYRKDGTFVRSHYRSRRR